MFLIMGAPESLGRPEECSTASELKKSENEDLAFFFAVFFPTLNA